MRRGPFPRLVLVSALTLLFGSGLVRPIMAPAQAADAALVFAVEQAILTRHIERPTPLKLLTAGLGGLRRALASTGVTDRLPDLAAEEASARSEFQARFDRAARLAQGRLTVTQLQYAAATAMAASVGDSATSFLTPELWEHDNQGFGKGLAGIGTYYVPRAGRFVIFALAPYSPAASAGLRRLDRILAIDGRSVKGMTKDEVDNRVHPIGGAGTTITLTVSRPGASAPLTVSMVRQRVLRFLPVEHRMLPGHLGYIWIRSLSRTNDAAEFRRAVVELQREGLHGLILDLRVHEPGDLQVLYVANTLLPAGVPVQSIVSDAHELVRPRRDACPMPAHGDRVQLVRAGALRMPSSCTDTTSEGALLDPATSLVVLIDQDTRGSGELLGAAIRATGRGQLLGVRTPGQLGWADWVSLPGGAGIKVESHIVLAGNGAVLDKVGVQPDVAVELMGQDLDRGVDTQLQRAVEFLSR